MLEDGSDFMGERLTVQFARGTRHREPNGFTNDRNAAPRPRRTPHRMQISGLPNDTSWQVCSISHFLFRGFSHGYFFPPKALERAVLPRSVNFGQPIRAFTPPTSTAKAFMGWRLLASQYA